MTIWQLVSAGVVVDFIDLAVLYEYSWYISSDGYVVTNAAGGEDKVLLHRHLLGAGPGQIVDHRDRNRLNNSRSNLRLTDRTTNRLNARIDTGITLAPSGRFVARFTFKNQRINLGTFDTYSAALAAKINAVKQLTNEPINYPHQ